MSIPATQPSTAPRTAWLEIHPSIGMTLMDHLWNRLDGAYPNRWRSAFANPQAIQNWREAWAEAFDEEGIRPEEIKAAISKCRRTFDWPPSLAEFLKVCRPPLNYEAAFIEAVEQMRKREHGEAQWSSPAIYWAASRIGIDLRAQPYSAMKGRWHGELDKAIAEIKAGTLPCLVPQKAVALPAPGEVTPQPEKVKEMLKQMRITLGGGNACAD